MFNNIYQVWDVFLLQKYHWDIKTLSRHQTLASNTKSVASLLTSVYFIISHDSRKLDSTLLLVKNSVTPHSVPGSKKENFLWMFLGKSVCYYIWFPYWPLEHSRVLEMIGSFIIQLPPARPVSSLPLTFIPSKYHQEFVMLPHISQNVGLLRVPLVLSPLAVRQHRPTGLPPVQAATGQLQAHVPQAAAELVAAVPQMSLANIYSLFMEKMFRGKFPKFVPPEVGGEIFNRQLVKSVEWRKFCRQKVPFFFFCSEGLLKFKIYPFAQCERLTCVLAPLLHSALVVHPAAGDHAGGIEHLAVTVEKIILETVVKLLIVGG